MISDWFTDWRTRQYKYQHFWRYWQQFPKLGSVSEQLCHTRCCINTNESSSKGFYGFLFHFDLNAEIQNFVASCLDNNIF